MKNPHQQLKEARLTVEDLGENGAKAFERYERVLALGEKGEKDSAIKNQAQTSMKAILAVIDKLITKAVNERRQTAPEPTQKALQKECPEQEAEVKMEVVEESKETEDSGPQSLGELAALSELSLEEYEQHIQQCQENIKEFRRIKKEMTAATSEPKPEESLEDKLKRRTLSLFALMPTELKQNLKALKKTETLMKSFIGELSKTWKIKSTQQVEDALEEKVEKLTTKAEQK